MALRLLLLSGDVVSELEAQSPGGGSLEEFEALINSAKEKCWHAQPKNTPTTNLNAAYFPKARLSLAPNMAGRTTRGG